LGEQSEAKEPWPLSAVASQLNLQGTCNDANFISWFMPDTMFAFVDKEAHKSLSSFLRKVFGVVH